MGGITMMERMTARQRKHVLFTWSAQQEATPISIARGQGAVFWDHANTRYIDFESQVFNCNAGLGERRIIEAMQRQLETLACAHPAAVFEAKTALGERLAAVTPGDLNRFFLCLSGAEAIENALKVARLVTGRQKVIARRRSYHGASLGALSLTGDGRRFPLEPGLWGVLRAEDPYCLRCPFQLEYPSCGVRCATHLEHIIELEGGGDQIAAVFLEGITGANGALVPPDEYWPIVRDICDRHGILLVADEVFSGFGRTGKWFAVDHWGVVPDMIAMAKGLTSGYAPLGALALREELAARFDDQTLWCGLTNYGHPVSCAAALAAIDVYEEDGLIQRAAALEPWLSDRLAKLVERVPAAIDHRGRGLLHAVELSEDPSPLKAALRARGVHALVRDRNVFICPPLCITQDELADGTDRVEQALLEVFGA